MERGKTVRVEMGRVSFWSDEIPVAGPRREVINEPIHLRGQRFNFCAATVGNPHCVLPLPKISAELARQWARCWKRTCVFRTASTCNS